MRINAFCTRPAVNQIVQHLFGFGAGFQVRHIGSQHLCQLGIFGGGIFQIHHIAECGHIGQFGAVFGMFGRKRIAAVGCVGGKPDIGGIGAAAVGFGIAALLAVGVALRIFQAAVGVAQVKGGNAGLSHGKQLAFIGAAVAVFVLPDAQR